MKNYYRHNIGDKVKIRNYTWYKDNANSVGEVELPGGQIFLKRMARLCGDEKTILAKTPEGGYLLNQDIFRDTWTDDMFEQPEQTKKLVNEISLKNCDLDEVEIVLGTNFKLEHRGERIFAVRKEFRYPSTYSECCKVLGVGEESRKVVIEGLSSDEKLELSKLESLVKLLRCRNAYWRILGKEMGLDEPWEPNWKDFKKKYIICLTGEVITIDAVKSIGHIFAFPTEDIAKRFLVNFEQDIEFCKEYL